MPVNAGRNPPADYGRVAVCSAGVATRAFGCENSSRVGTPALQTFSKAASSRPFITITGKIARCGCQEYRRGRSSINAEEIVGLALPLPLDNSLHEGRASPPPTRKYMPHDRRRLAGAARAPSLRFTTLTMPSHIPMMPSCGCQFEPISLPLTTKTLSRAALCASPRLPSPALLVFIFRRLFL